MASNVKITIDLEGDKAAAELKRLAGAFGKVEDSIEDADRAADKFAESGKKLKGFSGQVDKASAGTQQMSKALNSFGAKFLTMELAKKVAAFADATLSAAAANDKLSAETRRTAQGYLEIKGNVQAIGEGMVLATANVVSGLSQLGGIQKLIADAAEYWQAQANGDKSAEAVRQEQQLADAEKKLAAVKEKKAKAAKDKEDAAEKERLQRVEKRKQADQQANEEARAYADNVRNGLLSESDLADKVYSSELAKLEDAHKRKKVTDEDYLAWKERLYLERSKRLREIQEQENPATKENRDGGQAAADAAAEAERRAELRAKEDADKAAAREKELAAEKEKQQKVQELEQQTAAMRKQAQDTFLSGNIQLFSTLAKENRKYALIAKALSVAQALNNVREGVTKAIAQGGVWGAIMGIGVAASGFATVAEIKAQKYAAGGIVKGTSYTGDKVPALLNSREVVLNEPQQARLYAMANGQAAATSQPPSLTFNIGAGTDSVSLRKLLTENASEFARQVARVIRDPKLATMQGAL